MKKLIFCLTLLFIGTISASSQVYTKELDCSHLNIYMTCDTIKYYKDPDSGEVTVYPWSGAQVAEAMLTAGYPTGTGSSTDLDYVYAFRKDYTDPQTGFTVKKGYYRAPLIDNGNMNFYGGSGDGSSQHGYTNLKGVVLYFVGVPQTWLTSPISLSHADYPTGRVYAQYYDSEGVKTTNSAYREIHTSMSKINDAGGTAYFCSIDSNYVYGLPKFMGYKPHVSADGKSIEPRHVTYDQPFKLVIWFDNRLDVSTITAADFQTRLDANENIGEKGEWTDLYADNKTEEEFSYYFGKLEECNPYFEDDSNLGKDCPTGRNTQTGSWATKVPWTSDTPITWGVRKRMVLIGVSMISGSDYLPPKYINVADGQSAEVIVGDGVAYGSTPDNEYFPATTEKIEAGDAFSDRPFLRSNFVSSSGTYTMVQATSVKLNKSKLSLIVGETNTFSTTILPENATNKTVTWTSSNESVAIVSSEGVVTAIAAGTAIITATTNDGSNLSASCTVSVSNATEADTDIKQYDNIMYTKKQTVFPNTQITLPVYLKNNVDMTAFSFDLVLPTGMTVAKNANSKNIITLADDRKSDHTVASNTLEDGTVSVACLSLSSESFSGNDGIIAYVTIDVDESMAVGNYNVFLKNVRMATPSNVEYKVSKVVSTITVETYIPGKVWSDIDIIVNPGWNWISTPIENRETESAQNFTDSFGNIQYIASQTASLFKDNELGWFGNLNKIYATQGYKVNSLNSETSSMTISGYIDDSSIELNSGWTWIGYNVSVAKSISDALPNAVEGDVIKSKDSFATFTDGAWVGNLTMTPGQGYKYKTSTARSLSYNREVTSSAKAIFEVSQSMGNSAFTCDNSKYSDNTAIIAKINDIDNPDRYIIGAFVNDECRGASKVCNNLHFITIQGDEIGEIIDFRVYDTITDEIITINETAKFNAGIIGTVANPVLLTIGNVTGIENNHFNADTPSAIYDLQGRMLKYAPSHGIVITNGKKIVIK